MKNITMKELAQNKCKEMELIVACKSGNKNPDYYKSLKEFKLWQIITGLLNTMEDDKEIKINATLQDYFIELSQGGKRGTQIIVQEGDNVLQLLDKYKDIKDVWNKLKKACDESGLKIVGSDIVRA